MEIENAGKFCEILRQFETLQERGIQQMFKGTEDLNSTFNQIDVIGMYKTPHTMTELTLISSVQG